MWLQLNRGLPFLGFFFSLLYVESCHQQLWQVLSLLFHAFWHWNGWIINFFWTKFWFCWFQFTDGSFFTSFFPCLSVLRWTWRIGEFSGVYLLLSSLCFFFSGWGRMMWYTRVILPGSCPNTVGFADFSHLALLGCLTLVGPCSRRSLLCSRSCYLSTRFLLCGCGQVCSTVLHQPVTWGLGAQRAFFLPGRVLVAEVRWAQTEWGSHCPLHGLCCEESLHVPVPAGVTWCKPTSFRYCGSDIKDIFTMG